MVKTRKNLSLNQKTVRYLESQEINISGLVDDLLFWWVYFDSRKNEPEKTAEELQKEIIALAEQEKVVEKMVNKITVLHAALRRAEQKIDDLDIYLRTV